MGRMTSVGSVGSVADEAVVVVVVVVVVGCEGDMAVVCHLCPVMLKRTTPFLGARYSNHRFSPLCSSASEYFSFLAMDKV